MPSGRGLVLAAAALVLAVSGLALGVEEFVLLALAAFALLAWGAAVVLVQVRWTAASLAIDVDRPRSDVVVGGHGVVRLIVHSTGRGTLTPLVVEGPARWEVSHAGLHGALGARRVALVTGARVQTVAPRRRAPLRGRQVGWRLAALGPDTAVGVEAEVPTSQRGLWTLESSTVWCTDPLGLVSWPVVSTPRVHVFVVPDSSRTGAERLVPAGRSSGGGDAEGWAAPGGDEFAGLRPYVAGDRLSRLHWPALARSGELMVRDFVEPMAQLVEVPIDDRPAEIETSIRRAASLGVSLLERGAGVLLSTGGGERLVVSPAPGATTTLLRALATVAPATAPKATAPSP